MIANATDRLDLSLEPVIFDPPEASKRIGLIALATDLTTERDFMRVFPADQAAYMPPGSISKIRRRRTICSEWDRA